MEIILKKLDLGDILEIEMNQWYQTSPILSPNVSIKENSTSNLFKKKLDNLLSNKISETIQNIKIKKQNDFYKSQILKKEPNKSNSKPMKICVNLPKQDNVEIVFNEDSNEKNIFVNNSNQKINNISLKSSTLLTTSSTQPGPSLNISNISYMKTEIDNPLSLPQKSLNTGELARLKLSAFKYKKNSICSNNNQIGSNILVSPPIPKQNDFLNIFSIGDEDDLSYLDIV